MGHDVCMCFPAYCHQCALHSYGDCPGFARINNLKIKCSLNPNGEVYAVYTPDGRCWEDNLTFYEAIEYCLNTKDFMEE